MSIRIIHADMLEALPQLLADGVQFDAVVCDPPYHLTTNKKGGNGPASVTLENPYGRARVNTGFMGKQWDGGDIAFRPETWAAVLAVMKPGAHLIAFSGTRTYHRMACAIEDAGFEIRDQLGWLYGSGFPKSHDISKGIDKAAGRIGESVAEIKRNLREAHEQSGQTLGQLNEICGFEASGYFRQSSTWGAVLPPADKWPILRDALNLPGSMDALFAAAVREVVGAAPWTNSAAHFVPGEDHTNRVQLGITAPATDEARQWQGWGTALKPAWEPMVLARKPFNGTVAGNVLANGCGGLNIDACRVPVSDSSYAKNCSGDRGHDENTTRKMDFHMAAGSASDLGRWPANVIHDGSDEVLAAFAQSGERSAGGTPARRMSPKTSGIYGAFENDTMPDGIGGSTGSAARFFYSAKADATDRLGSKHPTVKPVDLMAYLLRLVTPAGGLVLDPFAGSGTTGMAALREGFDAVLIEREAEYVEDIKRRVAHVSGEDSPLFAGSAA